MYAQSANWGGAESVITIMRPHSGEWSSAYETLTGLSADWQSTYENVYELSGKWALNEADLTNVAAKSADWDTGYDDRFKWDGGATGLVAGTGRTSLGLGSIATQAADSVDIDGGAIDGTTVGSATPAAGAFTTLKVSTPGSAPTSPTASGAKGQIIYDDNYIYICTATNTWKRAALATW
jgi:hypothetical protein